MTSNGARSAWPAALLGVAGSALVAVVAPRAVPDSVVRWWYMPGWPVSRGLALVLLYAGMIALSVAWLALGRALPSRRALIGIAAAWALPLALAPPLFSRDIYSYLAQGTILHLGHSPYHSAPRLLAALGRRHLLDAVSPFWRGTTAPYGPLFLGIVSLIVAVTGPHIVAGVLLVRLWELGGLALLALALAHLARALGSDGRRALWLALLSPLTMLQLIAAGHNDLLMAGLLVAGLSAAVAGFPLLGVALCALATTIKVPALAGVVFITVAWVRAEPDRRRALWLLAACAATTVAVAAVVSIATGAGSAWLSSSLFATPAKVRLAITPSTGVGYTLGAALRFVGVNTTGRGIEATLGVAMFAATAVAGILLLRATQIRRVVAVLGAFLIVAAATGPAAWPWYFIWGLAPLAAVAGVQRSAALAVAIVAGSFVVKPDGILALPLGTAPLVVVVYLGVAGLAWRSWRSGGWGSPPTSRPQPAVGAAAPADLRPSDPAHPWRALAGH